MGPFFLWLNYMGWFRSDSLEELVGLDISYHGGQHMDDGDVTKEHMKAYNRAKNSQQVRRRGGGRSSGVAPGESSVAGASAEEACADDSSWMDMTTASAGAKSTA